MITIEEGSERLQQLIASWRYPEPYDFYDGDAEPVLNPERFFEARDEHGDTIGFYYFEPKPPDLDYGLGLRPDLTGQGRGLEFFLAGLAFAHERYRPERVLPPCRGVQRASPARLRAGRLPRRLLPRAHLRALRRGAVRDDDRVVISVKAARAGRRRGRRSPVAAQPAAPAGRRGFDVSDRVGRRSAGRPRAHRVVGDAHGVAGDPGRLRAAGATAPWDRVRAHPGRGSRSAQQRVGPHQPQRQPGRQSARQTALREARLRRCGARACARVGRDPASEVVRSRSTTRSSI